MDILLEINKTNKCRLVANPLFNRTVLKHKGVIEDLPSLNIFI